MRWEELIVPLGRWRDQRGGLGGFDEWPQKPENELGDLLRWVWGQVIPDREEEKICLKVKGRA